MPDEIKLTLDAPVPETPSLTLEGVEAPSLTLTPEEPAPAQKEEEVSPLDESALSPEERKVVEDFAQKIDITNSTLVLQYGSAAQKKIASFSDTTLNNVRTKDLGEVGNQISQLVVELKGFDLEEEEKKGIFGWFKSTGNKFTAMKAKYDSAEHNVDKIAGALESHQVQLLKDIVMLDKLYEMNLSYHKELSMYIIAGKKKLHDLELTRMVSVQMSPQIRLVQNNDKLMADKIQSTLVNTIPLWKSQMVLALGLAHSEQAVKAQREVSDMTNELLRKNAERLKMSTIETAKESERGVVDMETLRQTNQSLIQTLDEVVKIQDEGRAKRRAAEAEIGRLEGELKQKLLDIHT